jgi:type VI secretion system protein ImpM
MSQPASEVGFYGKLPFKGDFLQRRAPQEFVDVWDAWLQECLHESRRALQEKWLDAYLTSPVWRFVLAGGVCGEGAYAGILVPSVDRVGRYFPLTILTRLDAVCCPLDVACAGGQWFTAAETAVLTALEAADLDIDAFDEQIERLSNQLPRREPSESASLTSFMQHNGLPAQGAGWHVPLGTVHSLQLAVNVLAYRELSRALQPLALWWSDGSGAVGPRWLSTRGLPEARAFVAMLAGDDPEHQSVGPS